jgi:hypothetical protein
MGLRLRAKVKEKRTPSQNYIATIVDGDLVPVKSLPEPVWLEISEDGGFFVLYLDEQLQCFADSWHQTLEDALLEGLNFGIERDEWANISTERDHT